MQQINVLAIGTRVKIAEGITGIVIAVVIRGVNSIKYEVAWWNGRDQRTEHFQEWQMEPVEEAEPLPIGFRPNGKTEEIP